MAKKKTTTQKSFSTVKFAVELAYISPFFTKGGNSINWDDPSQIEKSKSAHMDDEEKKLLHSTLRANFHVEIKTNKKTFGEINAEMERLNNDPDFQKVVSLSKRYQELVVKETKQMLPDFRRDRPELIESDWKDKAIFDKRTVEYYTIIYNWVDKPEFESQLLDILQEFVDNKVDKYVELTMHYNCWGYYYKKQPCNTYSFSLQEIINHRRLALLIPVISAIVMLKFFKAHLVWWEILLPTAVCFIFIIIFKFSVEKISCSDTEYWGSHMVSASYVEYYETWVEKECSYETCTGEGKDRTCVTHYYDCSYCDHNSPYWYCTDISRRNLQSSYTCYQ